MQMTPDDAETVAPGHQTGRGLKLCQDRESASRSEVAPGHQTGRGLKLRALLFALPAT